MMLSLLTCSQKEWWQSHFVTSIFITKVEANQETIIHDFLSFQEFTITINLPGVRIHIMSHPTQTNWKSRWNKCPIEDKYHVLETYLISSWNQFRCRRKTKLRSRSLRVVVSSISPSGLSVVRPWEDPFRSNLLCILYSEQKRLPITMKRICFPDKHMIRQGNKFD